MKRRDSIFATGLAFVLALAFVIAWSTVAVQLFAQAPAPTVSQSYGLTLERDDYTAAAGRSVFPTSVTPRSNFVLVFRNGMLMREGVDYVKSSGSTVSFVVGLTVPHVVDGDLVTLIFQR